MALAEYSTVSEYTVIHSVKAEFLMHFSSFMQEELNAGRFSQADFEQISIRGTDFDLSHKQYCQAMTWELFPGTPQRAAFLTNLQALEQRYHAQYPGRA